jgi:hypothetical protein
MYEHKKKLCNTNMNYFFLFICKVKPNTNKKTMKIHQQFPITIMKIQFTFLLSSSFFNITYTLLSQENSPNYIQSKVIIFSRNDSQSLFILILIHFFPYHTRSICVS